MAQTGWDALRDSLAAGLTALTDGEFVILSEPVTYSEPGSGLFRRKPRPLPCRFVQYLRMEHYLGGECVGSTAFGGTWEISPADNDRIRALGWKAPGDTAEKEWGAPVYKADLPREEAPRLAQMGVDALRVLGLTPEALEFRRDS
jgi:hypothetical protein